MTRRLDPAEAEAVMRAAGLEPLEPFARGADPWLCRCQTCGRAVTPTYRNVAHGQGGCVWCSGHRTDPDDAAAIMRAAGLEPLEPFTRVMTPWRCRCLSCNREVRPILNNVRRGHAGCVYCAGRKNEPAEAAEVMLAAGVEPLEPYPGGQNPWRCRCLTCGREGTPRLSNVKQGNGACLYCSGKARHDEAEAVAVMRAAGLEPLEPYRNVDSPWRCRCLTCGREVAPTFHGVQSGQGGCVYCGGNKVDPDEAVALMRHADLEPQIAFPGSNVPWPCSCKRCGHKVAPTYSSVTRGNRCAYCSQRRVDPTEAVSLMRAAGLEPLDEYPGNKSPWRCRCVECGREVTPTYNNVASNRAGCLFCATHGFQHDKPGIIYVVTHSEFGAHKVGVAGMDTTRLDTHRRRGWQVYKTLRLDRGEDAYRVEQAIIRWWRDDLELPPYLTEGDGWTETVEAEAVSLPELWRRVLAEAESLTTGSG